MPDYKAVTLCRNLYLYVSEKRKTMASLDLRQDIHNYIDSADEKLLKMIKALVEIYHDDSERISIEQYNRELEASEAQIERGEFYTHEEMGERIKKWAKK